jgi:hypothetical protein
MKLSKWQLAALLAFLGGTSAGAGAIAGQEPAFFEMAAFKEDLQGGHAERFGRIFAADSPRGEAPVRYNERESPKSEVGFFYDELAPFGEWISTRAYGWAFRPHGVARDWRPYTQGRWALTDHGFTWVSAEPFGWATYHYGRWTRDSRQGWLWVPGTLWGPAWVSFRVGGGFVGWAPLAPSLGFDKQRGIGAGGALETKSECYVFVPEQYFLEPSLGAYLAPRIRNHQILAATAEATLYSWVEERVVNQGLASARFAALAGRRLIPLRVVAAGGKQLDAVGELELTLYRPEAAQLATVGCGERTDAGRGAALRQP